MVGIHVGNGDPRGHEHGAIEFQLRQHEQTLGPALVLVHHSMVGQQAVLRIDSPRKIFGDYPDDGCSAEIYTNPDPLAYVELEMLGPLHKMIAGDKITRASSYTLLRRMEVDPDLEVRRWLSR